MQATKEAARTAKQKFEEIGVLYATENRDEKKLAQNVEFIKKFIDACVSRLPSETAVAADRIRKRRKVAA